jgi:hypothetical protein
VEQSRGLLCANRLYEAAEGGLQQDDHEVLRPDHPITRSAKRAGLVTGTQKAAIAKAREQAKRDHVKVVISASDRPQFKQSPSSAVRFRDVEMFCTA